MDQMGYLTDQVQHRRAIAYTATGTTTLSSNIYDLSHIGARGVLLVAILATINAGNYFQVLGSNTTPSDGTFSATTGEWSGSTALTTTVLGSKIQGAANGDTLRWDCKNFPYRYIQFQAVRGGATTIMELALLSFYNFNKTPQAALSTVVTEQNNAPILGTA